MTSQLRWIPFVLLAVLGVAGFAAAQTPWLAPYGDGGCGSNFVPTFHTGGEMPVLGNAGFQVVSENLIGATPGLIFLSATSTNLPVLGMTLYVGPSLVFGVGCQANGAVGIAGAGAAILPLPIPNSSYLVGGKLYLQGFYLDATQPSSFVHSSGLGVTIAQSIPPADSVVRDRVKYQAHFSGVTSSTQADPLGRAIWTANQVPGFNYVKTEQFTCGGQTHWMVIVLHAQTGMEFCLIPGGNYQIGDINGTGGKYEIPVHWVYIKPILLARTEVPQSVWQAVMGSNPSGFQGPNLPVEMVDWNDAQSFCAKTKLRMPSESEWEYACRAGVNNCYNFGVNYVPPGPANLRLYAWYGSNSGSCSHPVGQILPNAFGLSDMYGNVWEWCEDWWLTTNDYACAPTDGKAWLGSSTIRVRRGGCWAGGAEYCRSSGRGGNIPSLRARSLGFRPACTLP